MALYKHFHKAPIVQNRTSSEEVHVWVLNRNLKTKLCVEYGTRVGWVDWAWTPVTEVTRQKIYTARGSYNLSQISRFNQWLKTQ